MRAIVLDDFGGPEVLRLAEIEKPEAAPGGVVVQVAYASVNPADWKSREGWLSRYYNYQSPFVVGFDAGGVVSEVGPGVTRLKVGDRVVTASNQGRCERGSYAEYVASDQERLVKLPDHISFQDAATLPTAGMTAMEATLEVGGAARGQKVLANGGAGGTGGFAIQLAKMVGAEVAATCGPANLDYVRSLGVDLAINYREGKVLYAIRAWAPEGVDLVVDTVGQGTLIADEPMPDAARAEELGVRVVVTSSTFENQERQLNTLVEALADGRIRAPEKTILPLADAAEAHRRVAEGHVRGKTLLQFNSELGK